MSFLVPFGNILEFTNYRIMPEFTLPKDVNVLSESLLGLVHAKILLASSHSHLSADVTNDFLYRKITLACTAIQVEN